MGRSQVTQDVPCTDPREFLLWELLIAKIQGVPSTKLHGNKDASPIMSRGSPRLQIPVTSTCRHLKGELRREDGPGRGICHLTDGQG